MYAGCITCCPLVSHGEYADGTDRGMDGRQTVTHFLLDAASVTTQHETTSVIYVTVHHTHHHCTPYKSTTTFAKSILPPQQFHAHIHSSGFCLRSLLSCSHSSLGHVCQKESVWTNGALQCKGYRNQAFLVSCVSYSYIKKAKFAAQGARVKRPERNLRLSTGNDRVSNARMILHTDDRVSRTLYTQIQTSMMVTTGTISESGCTKDK